MKVRFGFVAMAMSLTNASPSQTMTVSRFESIVDGEAALRKLTRIATSNLTNTLRVLRHANASGVHIYRFSSKLIPLFGHPLTKDWDFLAQLKDEFEAVGDFVHKHKMRVSFHPEHYTVLNSPSETVLLASIDDLLRHVQMLEAMKLDEKAKLVIHVGGSYKNKAESLARLVSNWEQVPFSVRNRLTFENDDKTYTAADTLKLCQQLGVPMVLDVHHHRCQHEESDNLAELLPQIVQTWANTDLVPKVHMSSPKGAKDFRSHADNIKLEDLLPFLNLMGELNQDVDIMLEAKHKDEAVFQLMKELQKVPGVQVIDGGSIYYKS